MNPTIFMGKLAQQAKEVMTRKLLFFTKITCNICAQKLGKSQKSFSEFGLIFFQDP